MSDRQHREEENEVVAHRFHMDIFQKGDLSAADQILATNFVWRNSVVPSELAHGREGVKKIASAVIDSMSDLKITHDDTMSKGDKVMIRWTMTGTA
jgi:predicted SnoaL-like aldol condensation-catalyzing enzyme